MPKHTNRRIRSWQRRGRKLGFQHLEQRLVLASLISTEFSDGPFFFQRTLALPVSKVHVFVSTQCLHAPRVWVIYGRIVRFPILKG